MNTSYKIVLVSAAVICVVVLLYSFSGGSTEADPNVSNPDEGQPEERLTLADANPRLGGTNTPTIDEPDAEDVNDLASQINSLINDVPEEEIEEVPAIELTAETPAEEAEDTNNTTVVFGDDDTAPPSDTEDLLRQPEEEREEELETPILDKGGPVVIEEPAEEEIIPEPTTTEEVSTREIPDGGTYTVVEGDSLSIISQKLYGSAKYWVQISQANPTMDPQRLSIGQVIKLPSASEITPSRNPVPVEGDLDNVPPNFVVYTVQAGDTLTSISIQYYNTDKYWDVIHDANRSRIGNSPDKIREGMKLMIPPSPNRAQ